MSGNARGATSAFCLLVRLGQLKPTDEQVQQLLDHTDSPYIRAVGACPSPPSGHTLATHAPAEELQPSILRLPPPVPCARVLCQGAPQAAVSLVAVAHVNIQHTKCVVARLSTGAFLQIGFLYLRYVLDPRTIWDWLQYYIKDHEVRHMCIRHSCRMSACRHLADVCRVCLQLHS
jgi:PRP38 family